MAARILTNTLLQRAQGQGARWAPMLRFCPAKAKLNMHLPKPPPASGRLQLYSHRMPVTCGAGGDGGAGGKNYSSVSTGGPGNNSGGSAWSWYTSLLQKHPLLTKAITCALLNALGDIICQVFFDKQGIDAKRCATFTFMGLVLVGPTLHYWYTLLNYLVPARGSSGAMLQLLLDQLVFAPLFLGTFIAVLFTIENKSDQIKGKLEQDLFSTVKANWILWVPAQYLNFRFVSPSLQVLTANVVALAWNVYMSYVSHKRVEPAFK